MAAVTSSTGDIERVLASAAAGDELAFASIVAAHHEDMRRVCVVVVGDEDVADEAVEAAWSKAWRKLGSVREPARLRAWLVSIAVNEARQLVGARRVIAGAYVLGDAGAPFAWQPVWPSS
jgi:RNA polymerase sigma-70 factor (ECF subfamily)